MYYTCTSTVEQSKPLLISGVKIEEGCFDVDILLLEQTRLTSTGKSRKSDATDEQGGRGREGGAVALKQISIDRVDRRFAINGKSRIISRVTR